MDEVVRKEKCGQLGHAVERKGEGVGVGDLELEGVNEGVPELLRVIEGDFVRVADDVGLKEPLGVGETQGGV